MQVSSFAPLISNVEAIEPVERYGVVNKTGGGLVDVTGLSSFASVGDLVMVSCRTSEVIAEVLTVSKSSICILPEAGTHGVSVGDAVRYVGSGHIFPDLSWVGRVIDAYANPLDGMPVARGREGRSVLAAPRWPPKESA